MKTILNLLKVYSRKVLLIDFYITELLKLVLNNANRNKMATLNCLSSKLSTQLRAFTTFEITSKMSGKILYPLVESS